LGRRAAGTARLLDPSRQGLAVLMGRQGFCFVSSHDPVSCTLLADLIESTSPAHPQAGSDSLAALTQASPGRGHPQQPRRQLGWQNVKQAANSLPRHFI